VSAGAALTLAQELPVPALPDDPAWRENFCFDGYDAVRDIGFWLHMGRWSLDPSLWREQVHLMLPGGRLVVARSFGRRDIAMSAAGPCMAFTCAAPGRAWRLTYHGPGRETSRAELASAPIPEGPRALLDFDIAFDSSEGVWDFGAAAKGEDWASAHYEQTGRAHGRVVFDGEAFAIDGFGWRDHSWGPRYWQVIYAYRLLLANFGEDRGFMLLKNIAADGRARRLGVVLVDGGYEDVLDLDLTTDWSADRDPERMRIAVRTPNRRETIEARVLILAPLRNRRQVGEDTLVSRIAEGFTEFTWDGRTGYGMTEYIERVEDGVPVGYPL
jgi:hypothetical protein